MALSFAEAVALPQADRIERFAIEALSAQRAFSAMGKLFRVIESNLESGQSIFPLLIGAGIKKGTVSNASYAAKVFDLVDQGHLTEAEYDTLAFNDCWQICRVQSKTSKRQLTAAEVSAVVRSSADFADDLTSLYETGLTAEERAAAEAKAKAAKAEAEAKAAAKAEAEKAELEALRKHKAELDAAAKHAEEDKPEAEADKPEAKDDKKPEAKKPDDKADAKKPDAKKPEANTPPPAPAAKITAEDLLRLLDEVEAGLTRLSALDQDRVAARILELAELATIKA
jgi:hypothetical protein